MHSIANALAKGDGLLSRWFADKTGDAGDLFSSLYGSKLRGQSGGGDSFRNIIEQLGARFPGLAVSVADPAEGVEEARKRAEASAGEDDEVVVSESAASIMASDADFAKRVEEVISAFLERTSGGNILDFAGTQIRRSVSISITTVSYSELHYSQATGGFLAGSDLRSNFHERLDEMIREFFGVEDADKAAKGEDGETAAQSRPASGMGGLSMWSMQLFYSSSFVSSLSGEADEASADSLLEAWQASASFSASFTRAFGGFLPQAALGAAAAPGEHQNVNLLLNGVLANFGLESTGFRMGGEGILANLRAHRDLLAELMENYNEMIGRVEGDPVSETAPAAEASVGAVAAV